MNDIYTIIKGIRKKNGLTQKDFASIIGLKQNTLSMIESGKNLPTIETLYTIIKEFDVDANVFFTEFGNQLISKHPVFPVGGENPKDNPNSSLVLEVTEKELDDLIKYKLHYMEFYLLGISYHVRCIQERELGIKFDENHYATEEAYINHHNQNILAMNKPGWVKLSMPEKLDFIRELDEAIRQYLDNIWSITSKLV